MENNIKIEIGSRLKSVRLSFKYTLADISQNANIGSSFISQMERGLKKPSAEYLLYLANEGININWILTGKGEMFSPKEDKNNKTKLSEIISFLEILKKEQK